ncbi:MAG: fibronectin type III domain-containing protein, partial [Deltaproteobacteria bacterium]
MRTPGIVLAAALSLLLTACGSTSGTAPGAPTNVSVAPGATAGTAVVSFTAPASSGTSAILGYTVTVAPGGITAIGTSSPIAVTGLTPATAYTYSVVASSVDGTSSPATTGSLRFYSVVQTFHEPMTPPNDSIFTGTFTFDTTARAVSNLTGSLTQAMSGSPMATVPLAHQLSAVAASPGG